MSTRRGSLLYLLIIYFLWKSNSRQKFKSILHIIDLISYELVKYNIVEYPFSSEEINDEISRLKNWRVISETYYPVSYELNEKIKQSLIQSDDLIKQISKSDETKTHAMKIMDKYC